MNKHFKYSSEPNHLWQYAAVVVSCSVMIGVMQLNVKIFRWLL